MMNEAIKTIMTKNPLCLSPEDSIAQARDIFLRTRIHHIPVCEDGVLVGLVTTYDLWKMDIPFNDYDRTLIKDAMTTRLAKVSPNDKIGTAAELFLDNRFHALPVVDEDQRIVGIVTSFDVLRYEFKKEYKDPILYKEILDGNSKKIFID